MQSDRTGLLGENSAAPFSVDKVWLPLSLPYLPTWLLTCFSQLSPPHPLRSPLGTHGVPSSPLSGSGTLWGHSPTWATFHPFGLWYPHWARPPWGGPSALARALTVLGVTLPPWALSLPKPGNSKPQIPKQMSGLQTLSPPLCPPPRPEERHALSPNEDPPLEIGTGVEDAVSLSWDRFSWGGRPGTPTSGRGGAQE